jgi:hypothetical protein
MRDGFATSGLRPVSKVDVRMRTGAVYGRSGGPYSRAERFPLRFCVGWTQKASDFSKPSPEPHVYACIAFSQLFSAAGSRGLSFPDGTTMKALQCGG